MSFTADDAERHRRCARVARRVLEDRITLRTANAQAHAFGYELDHEARSDHHAGGEPVDEDLRDRIQWHTSMAQRIEGLLGG